jgi:hypothetical protein
MSHASTGPEIHPRTARLMARVRAAQDGDGRLALPDVTEWDIFPFEGDLLVKHLDDPVLPEPARTGEGGRPCESCDGGLARAIWTDGVWKLTALDATPIPIVLLQPIAHLDSTDLDEAMAAGLGVMSVRLERVLMALGGVGRVHVMKIGDGGSHLHVWFFARPEGVLQLRGSSLSDWSDTLPPMPRDEWGAVLDEIAAAMATGGGRDLRARA